MEGAVPHTHLHQGIMGPQCAGISNFTDNPVGMVGLSTSKNFPRSPKPSPPTLVCLTVLR